MKNLIDFYLNTILPNTFLMMMFCVMVLSMIILIINIPYKILLKKLIGTIIQLEPRVYEDEYAYLKKPIKKTNGKENLN